MTFQFFSEQMQAHQWNPPELEWQELKDKAIKKKNSASGADGLSLELLRQLPDDAWVQLTQVLSSIEDNHEDWPAELLDVTWVAIGKADSGGVAAPLKFRSNCCGLSNLQNLGCSSGSSGG